MIHLAVSYFGDGGYLVACVLRGSPAMEYPFRASVVINHNVTVVIDAAGLSEVQVDGGGLVVEVVEIVLVQAAPDVVAEDGNLHGGEASLSKTRVFSPM